MFNNRNNNKTNNNNNSNNYINSSYLYNWHKQFIHSIDAQKMMQSLNSLHWSIFICSQNLYILCLVPKRQQHFHQWQILNAFFWNRSFQTYFSFRYVNGSSSYLYRLLSVKWNSSICAMVIHFRNRFRFRFVQMGYSIEVLTDSKYYAFPNLSHRNSIKRNSSKWFDFDTQICIV